MSRFQLSTKFQQISLLQTHLNKKEVRFVALEYIPRLLILDAGIQTGPKLLFLPDFALSMEDYAPLLNQLSNAFCIASFDWPGQGGSNYFSGVFSRSALDSILTNIIKYFEWSQSRFHVVAHGSACAIAAQFFQASNLARSCLSINMLNPTFVNPKQFTNKQQGCCAVSADQLNYQEVRTRIFTELETFSQDLFQQISKRFDEPLERNSEQELQRIDFYCRHIVQDQPQLLSSLQKQPFKILIIFGEGDLWLSGRPDFGDIQVIKTFTGHLTPLVAPDWVVLQLKESYIINESPKV